MKLGYPKDYTPAITKGFDPDVLKRLRAYKQENNLTQAALALELGCAEATVSKYLGEKPHGDVKRFEETALDIINNAALRKQIKILLFDTAMAQKVHGACQLARKLNDFVLVSGPAGIGKSCGAESYLFANPATILVTAAVWNMGWIAALNLIWCSIETKWNGQTKKADYLVNRFRGSNRLIIVDNAHRIRKSGFKFLFDFHDATQCPFVLIGNPEVIETIKENDQHFSRIGRHTKITVNDIEEPNVYADRMIKTFAPRFADCRDLAVKLLLKPGHGHLRTLRKILNDAEEMATNDAFRKHCEKQGLSISDLNRKAFLASTKQQVRDYQL